MRSHCGQARALFGALLLALTLALTSTAARGQIAKAAQPSSKSGKNTASTAQKTIHVRVNLVNFLFTVTNKKGLLLPDLGKSDFQIYEDGSLQKITDFSRQTNLPLRIGVLIDTSNSIRPRLEFEKQAAIDFLNAVIRPSEDQAFVVSFDVEPQLLQDYTGDVDKLSDAIRSLSAGGGTGLFDAVYYACKQRMIFFPPPQPYLRRVLVIVSDGQDNESQHSLDEALSMAERAEAVVFCVSTNRSGISTRGDKVLKYLAAQTGGAAFFPFEASDLAGAYKTIATELRTQYSLAYYSTNKVHDGTFRRVRIKPLGKGLHVHARAGYFAPSA
jgi:Ca-activated chloride channel homolog